MPGKALSVAYKPPLVFLELPIPSGAALDGFGAASGWRSILLTEQQAAESRGLTAAWVRCIFIHRAIIDEVSDHYDG